ncbi:MAG: type II toxin-antitoxin system VapC family toxin [Lentisphaerae bacterium]|nr:type II toxin-antitoxin system VapC family toxin [Lentisphaerota bacterium]
MVTLLHHDPVIVTWWGSEVECYSALMRLVREGALDQVGAQAAEERLRLLRSSWHEVLPSETCRSQAKRMLRVHLLRAADSLQCAAALVAADHDPSRMQAVSLDQRLNDAFYSEGFVLVTGPRQK